jgi:hypothetical protein
MLQLVKTKRQANFKHFKRFGAFKALVEKKKSFSRVLNWPTHTKKAQFTHELVKYSTITRGIDPNPRIMYHQIRSEIFFLKMIL